MGLLSRRQINDICLTSPRKFMTLAWSVKVNKRTQEMLQSDPHQVLNITGKDRQIQINSHKKVHRTSMVGNPIPKRWQYVCNESAKYRIASTNTLRRVYFTIHALYSYTKATFQVGQKEITLKESATRPFFLTTTSHQYQHLYVLIP